MNVEPTKERPAITARDSVDRISHAAALADVTHLLQALQRGDRRAADELLPLLR